MQRAVSGRSILFLLLHLVIAQQVLMAQPSGNVSPLQGYNFFGVYAGGNFSTASIDPGLIPAYDDSFTLSAPRGTGFEFSLSFGRLMPALFVSTSTTAEFRLVYARLIGTASGSGTVRQSTTVATTIAGGQVRFAFDTRQMAQVTPTILVGATFGHIADVEYETTYTPAGTHRNNPFGVPEGTSIPARRWFYSSLQLGAGGRINLGDPATSPAIVPEIEVIIPLTSLARYNTWTPFGLRGGIGLRWPI